MGDKYRNILIIQHDDELVTPGDAAFILECDFSKPRDLAVSADLNEPEKRQAVFLRCICNYYPLSRLISLRITQRLCVSRGVRSSISLVDADPGRDEAKRAAYVESDTERVVFVPNSIRRVNDEL